MPASASDEGTPASEGVAEAEDDKPKGLSACDASAFAPCAVSGYLGGYNTASLCQPVLQLSVTYHRASFSAHCLSRF